MSKHKTKPEDTLDVYGHVTDEMKRNSADRMESYLQALSNS